VFVFIGLVTRSGESLCKRGSSSEVAHSANPVPFYLLPPVGYLVSGLRFTKV